MERSTQIPQREKASDQRKETIEQQLLAIRDSVSEFTTFLPRPLSYLHDY